jgi:hypothetical protein
MNVQKINKLRAEFNEIIEVIESWWKRVLRINYLMKLM